MPRVVDPFRFVLIAVAGWMNPLYPKTENDNPGFKTGSWTGALKQE
jgi:hypothetical protein